MTDTRFAPSRAGIINVWDYRDEEFLFVDGWLVLRGPNGSGKTKALEVLFPYLLDGRIEPRRLNPFASEDRTMKSNLLYRGQDVAHGYVWMEFQKGAEFVTIGIGLRAHRHVDKVTRHHFVADGRVGADISLLTDDDRPVSRKELTAQIGAEHVFESPQLYRHAIDTRLFQLGADRYEQLLDLVLTLRKPQLAKDLNPVELSRTLQRGLRPLDDTLIAEAAGSFDDMEAVAATLDGLKAAEEATNGFLSVYSTYLRTHARAAADAVSTRRTAVADRAAQVASARTKLADADAAVTEVKQQLASVEGEPNRLRAHLSRLRSSAAYQSHEQLADIQRHLSDLEREHVRATSTVTREKRAVAAADIAVTGAQQALTTAEAQVSRHGDDLRDAAETAGIDWSSQDARPAGFADRAAARVTARLDDIRAVRTRAAEAATAELARAAAEKTLGDAVAAVDQAEDSHRTAEQKLAEQRAQLRDAIHGWHDDHHGYLNEIDGDLLASLTEAGDLIGEPGSPTLKEIFTERTNAGLTGLRSRIGVLDAQIRALEERQATTVEERERIAAEHDDAPAPTATRTADRAGRAGAPLWRLIRFADHLESSQAAGVEAALEAAGLLDAWITPDGQALDLDGDAYLRPLPVADRPVGRTLADLLTVEEQDFVPAPIVRQVLASIAIRDGLESTYHPVLTVEGAYAQGIVLGAYTKDAPEFIGATARAARRIARIAECTAILADLAGKLDAVGADRRGLRAIVDNTTTAGGHLPPTTAVHKAVSTLDQAATTLRLRHSDRTKASSTLDEAVAAHSAATARLRHVCGERRLPVESLDETTAATARFDKASGRLEQGWRDVASSQRTLDAAQRAREQTGERADTAIAELEDAAMRMEAKREEYQTLTAVIDSADIQAVLADVNDTERRINEAEELLKHLRNGQLDVVSAHADARRLLLEAEAALQTSFDEVRREAERLRPFAHADLLGILRCPTDLRWPDQTTDVFPPEVAALHEAILTTTRDLSPTENSLKQSATRMTAALDQLQMQLPAAGLDHRPEWDPGDGVIVVRIADEQGLSPIAHFATRITRERTEQEQLLSEAERRILEDALLTELARQIHLRTIDARDLVRDMDRQMRARRMSSGLTVGVGWRLDDRLDTPQRDASALLQKDPASLGPGQLASLRRTFADRIKTAHAVNPELSYRDLLAQVLDYRQWHTFEFTLIRPGAGEEKLTRGRHSQLSGGEQSVSLHLPLFAAANAIFSSARPDSPRLIGLDEAFAGVDENGRGELMTLATQFDLDLFMTGYDLWATHTGVTGAAHYDLSHSAIDHAVSCVLVVWNGEISVADFDGTLARALGSPETRRAPAAVA